jgi:hypothetical protein
VRDGVACSVGENASTSTSPEVRVEHVRPKDEAGSIGECTRDDDEGESKSEITQAGASLLRFAKHCLTWTMLCGCDLWMTQL